jgi:hypothetical protein
LLLDNEYEGEEEYDENMSQGEVFVVPGNQSDFDTQSFLAINKVGSSDGDNSDS